MTSKLLSVLLLVLCATALVVAQDIKGVTPADADQLEKEISEIHAAMIEEQAVSLKSLKDSLNAGGASNINICVGGSDPNKMTYKDYLKAFAAGPCTPIVFLAGITGTKLRVLIDCQTLKDQQPQVFSDCKWTTCTKSFLNLGLPKTEYTTWIPDVLAPMNVNNPNASQRKCFAGLVGMKWTIDPSGKLIPVVNPGVVIKPLGMSPETRTNSRCGFDAITDIYPNSVPTPALNKVYENLRIKLEAMGYKIGLNLQAMPFDWRLPYYDNQVHHEFAGILEEMYKISGKKVSIGAHSFGNVNTINVLRNMSSENRSQWVKRYFALAPPYLGSPTTWSMLIGADGGFDTFDFPTFAATSTQFASIFDLMPRETWSLYQDSNWLKSIKNRIQTDQGNAPTYDIPADLDIVSKILPPKNDICYNKNWAAKNGDNSCNSGLNDFTYFGNINGDPVNDNTISHSLESWSFSPQSKQMFNVENRRPDYDRIDNPEVETVVIYSTIIATTKEFYWNYDPKTKTQASVPEFAQPSSVITNLGDGNVVTASALTAAFKWAYEFDQKMDSKAKPIILAELCSIKNPKSSVYQSGTSVTANEYQSIPCNCNTDDEKKCGHTGLVSEDNVVNYLADSLLDEQTAVLGKFFTWTEADIKSYVTNCNLLYKSTIPNGYDSISLEDN